MAKRRNPDWNELESAASKKRSGTSSAVRPKTANSSKISTIMSRHEMVVQRLSSDLSGKTPKYASLGPREFVPYIDNEFTISGIKMSCLQYFGKIDPTLKHSDCDVLASERGPSCNNTDQIPNVALIHVRFVEKLVESTDMPIRNSLETRKPMAENTRNVFFSKTVPFKSTPLVSKQQRSKFLVKRTTPSLSLMTMMKVGQPITDTPEVIYINVSKFDIKGMFWEEIGTNIKFLKRKKPVGEGTFRTVYEASCNHEEFKKKKWVIKFYNEGSKQAISETHQQTLEQHTRKVVQMACLANHFAKKLGEIGPNLPQFKYVDTLMGEISETNEFVTVEELLDNAASFEKYTNNDGICIEEHSFDEHGTIVLKAECLMHFSFEKSEEKLLLTDIQGCGYILTDPEVASSEISNGDEVLFCVGNYCRKAIKNFALTHTCNLYCRSAGLKEIDADLFDDYDETITFPNGVTV